MHTFAYTKQANLKLRKLQKERARAVFFELLQSNEVGRARYLFSRW